MQIDIKKLHDDVKLPHYATSGSAGLDLVAHNFKTLYQVDNIGFTDTILGENKIVNFVSNHMVLAPKERVLIGTGLSVQLPEGFEMQIRPRSGLALKEGVTVLNSPGTIDCDYTGEISIILVNTGVKDVIITLGDKIAQAVIAKYEHVRFNIVDELKATERGEGGFGHTDNKSSQ